ncbi:hypothetical protein ABPG74_019087 [Tetrahymena malaccensis]
MNKLFATIGIMAITVSSVLGSPPTPGNSVQCGTPSQSGNSADCQPCGSTNDIQNLFTPQTSPTCLVSQCYNISIDVINGFVCSSCSKYEAFYPFGSGKVNFDPTTQTCVSSCPAGYSPDMYLNCQPSGGSSVNCGTPGSGGNPGNTCASSCSQGYAPDANNICQNVSGTSVACGTASTGRGACVSSCSGGQVSDATNTCQKVSGADVNCGTASNAGGGACVSSCSGGQVSDATNTCQAVSGADVNCGTATELLALHLAHQVKLQMRIIYAKLIPIQLQVLNSQLKLLQCSSYAFSSENLINCYNFNYILSFI